MHASLDSNPIARLLNPHKLTETIDFKDGRLAIHFTDRAKERMRKRERPLIVEMQIYFSCLVQKRVLFHDTYEHRGTPVNDKLAVALRAVESDRCDPEHFHRHHPVQRELTSAAARKMRAKALFIDYIDNAWVGSFNV